MADRSETHEGMHDVPLSSDDIVGSMCTSVRATHCRTLPSGRSPLPAGLQRRDIVSACPALSTAMLRSPTGLVHS